MSDLRNNQQTTAKKSHFHANPMLNRVTKVKETAVDGKTTAYRGIMMKTLFFLLWTVAGMLLYLALDAAVFAKQPQTLSFNYRGFTVSTSPLSLGIVGGVAVLGIVMQILAAFVISTVPVTGTIYSVTQGYFISFMVFTILKGYEFLGLLALAITITIVLVMAILYTTGVIRATKKFRMVMLTLFFTVIGISILTFLGSLIPLTRPFVTMIMNNFWISLLLTLASIVIASLFLISDFAAIEDVVNNNLPAKYEWSAAFGLVFTVLWIYVKVLDLLIQIIGSGKSN